MVGGQSGMVSMPLPASPSCLGLSWPYMDLKDTGRAEGDLPWAASAATGPGSTQCSQSLIFSLWTLMSLLKTCLGSVPIHSVPPTPSSWFWPSGLPWSPW